MNTIARAALAALICAPLAAQAPSPRAGQQPHSPEEAFRRADTNNDGKVSYDEMHARRPNLTQAAFERMDTNKDGFLTPTDRPEARKGPARNTDADNEARGRMLDKVMLSDANADGKVSYDEIASAKPGFARPDFERLDRNSDGFVSRADAAQQPRSPEDRPRPTRTTEQQKARGATPEQRAAFRERMQGADANADGKVTFSEAQTAFPQMTQDRFKQFDRSGDGSIGPEDSVPGAEKRKAQ